MFGFSKLRPRNEPSRNDIIAQDKATLSIIYLQSSDPDNPYITCSGSPESSYTRPQRRHPFNYPSPEDSPSQTTLLQTPTLLRAEEEISCVCR